MAKTMSDEDDARKRNNNRATVMATGLGDNTAQIGEDKGHNHDGKQS